MFWKYQFKQQNGSLSCLGLQGRISKDVCEQQERMKTIQGDQLGGSAEGMEAASSYWGCRGEGQGQFKPGLYGGAIDQ